MEKNSPTMVTELTLDIEQSVRIGDRVLIKLTKVNKLQARFSIEAPRHVAVWREEIHRTMTSKDQGE
ncbi:carbon storage regulator [Xanthomonas arboricola]|uniref:Carbon storage regulator CsrA n=1 Tax=Xanthomonas arboricola TaxID=56448 RepID=A0AB73H1X3_9XANT|nr:carbon storage regulator [Xanthomonas arboricola]MBB5672337.1 carbon storage regulator CsrA [Xanthomonas arboricola]